MLHSPRTVTTVAKASEGLNIPSMNHIDSELPGLTSEESEIEESHRWLIRPPDGSLRLLHDVVEEVRWPYHLRGLPLICLDMAAYTTFVNTVLRSLTTSVTKTRNRKISSSYCSFYLLFYLVLGTTLVKRFEYGEMGTTATLEGLYMSSAFQVVYVYITGFSCEADRFKILNRL